MAVLDLGKPVTQADPFLLVENRLAPGRYRFRLVAIDSAGLESAPADLIVTVDAPPPPPPPPPPSGPFRPVFRPDLIDRVINTGILRPIRRPIG
jgi:hypothetical protein